MASENSIIPIIENRLYFLFKRGQFEHIKALYEEGDVYISSIDFIRKCDDNADRTDIDDGIFSRKYIGDAKITVCEIGKDLDKDGLTLNSSNVVFKNDHKGRGNIYCLTGIYSEQLSGNRNNIIFETKPFGESIVFIHNPRVFIDRLLDALKKSGYTNIQYGKVSYYKNDYSGAIGFFKKHEKFKHQNEYRIFIPNSKDEPIRLKIGSLKDFASFNTGILKLKYEDNIEQLITL